MYSRVADYIIDYIYRHGTDTIFTVAGGGAMFLNDAVALHKKITYICNHHEQASAMAAEAYAKTKGHIGAAMITSGPGSTNAITGLMEAYQNSIPVIFISSQTKKSQMIAYSGITGLRQFGIQEVDIIPVVKHLTKYAAIVEKPEDVQYHLDKAYYVALSGRPGPVWLDIPSDVASSSLPQHRTMFTIPQQMHNGVTDEHIKKIISLLSKSKKPLIIAGGGIKLAKTRNEFRAFINKSKIPVVCPDMGIDILEYDNPYYVGHGGTKGDRAANIVIQQSDLIISLGSRLAVPFIGHEYDTWAPNAYKIVVDIDESEHKKKTITIDLFIHSDVKQFLKKLNACLNKSSIKDTWIHYCQNIKKSYALKYATVSTDKTQEINMYDAIHEISNQSKPNDVFITDAGITAYVSTQTIKIKKDQRLILPGATLTMGYNLPAIIGVWAADRHARIICITGDGSFQMNIHELAAITHNKIPVKIFIMNNHGYLAIRTTQKIFFNKRLIGEGPETGVSFPNTEKIAQAYGLKYFCIEFKKDLHKTIKRVLTCKGAVICDCILPYWQDHITVSSKELETGKIVSLPIDDMYPYLSDEDKLSIKSI
ncbi:MAG: Thiamine pyrophosphate protein central region [Microgenomates group bacterium GW2011_GWC1_43_11]|nr:MAG: Thiamine pyrophosphate protein central region [Microgenomates group bacterium GW2011_GWC1_43_11]